MIGVIAEQTLAIGLGMAGAHRIEEVPPNATKEQILEAIKKLKNEVKAILLTTEHMELVKDHDLVQGIFLVEIPTGNQGPEIEEIIKEVLGVQMK